MEEKEVVVNEVDPYRATYRCLYESAPLPESSVVRVGSSYKAHGERASLQLFVGRERMWFFVYSWLPDPTLIKGGRRYTEEGRDAYVAWFRDLYLARGLRFAGIYESRSGGGLTDFEEGVMKSWSFGRVVLVGDAAHKVTPNIGMGFNGGVQDLVVLVNGLRGLLRPGGETGQEVWWQDERGKETEVTDDAIRDLFSRYQAERSGPMAKTNSVSGQVTRTRTWWTTLQ